MFWLLHKSSLNLSKTISRFCLTTFSFIDRFRLRHSCLANQDVLWVVRFCHVLHAKLLVGWSSRSQVEYKVVWCVLRKLKSSSQTRMHWRVLPSCCKLQPITTLLHCRLITTIDHATLLTNSMPSFDPKRVNNKRVNADRLAWTFFVMYRLFMFIST